MLYKRLNQKHELAVLRLDVAVLDLEGVVVTDGNAAAGPTRFDAPAVGLDRIDRAVTFAEWWTHEDPYEKAEHRRRMCAEVLVPERVPPEFINRIVVAGREAHAACRELPWPRTINAHVFFG
jgi:ssDNA thymidine ADP-ribosyltransferase, DarT